MLQDGSETRKGHFCTFLIESVKNKTQFRSAVVIKFETVELKLEKRESPAF